MGDQQVRYIYLRELTIDFIKRRPRSELELVFKDEAGVTHKSNKFKEGDIVLWDLNIYVRAHSRAALTIQRALFKTSVAHIEFEFEPTEFGDYGSVALEDSNHCVTVKLHCGRSKFWTDFTCVLGSQARINLTSKVLRFLKLSRLAALPPPTSDRGYKLHNPACIHWLNDDILLAIFNSYRLDADNGWNVRLGWCRLSHVCQRWRHLIYECALYLGVHLQCTNGTPVVDTLDHLPPLPLFIDYNPSGNYGRTVLTEDDELGIYHALQLCNRVCHIEIDLPTLLPSVSHEVLVLMDKHFPILERLSLSFACKASITLALPKAFLAPNLHHLSLVGIGLPTRLRLLTSTTSLVTLKLSNIGSSTYFRPRLLAARLGSLPQLKELSIEFSAPIPRPSTEREQLGEQRAPVTLPSLKTIRFKGVGTYLESLIAQIRTPPLEHLHITLFNQIIFAMPHLSYLINATEAFKVSRVRVGFHCYEVYIAAVNHDSEWLEWEPFRFRVMCDQLDWQVHGAAQICNALIPALSGVENLVLHRDYMLQDIEGDTATWHDLLMSFTGVKALNITPGLAEELSRALQALGVGSDPGFLPDLQSIHAWENLHLFAAFIDTRQLVGRPVQFSP